MPLTRRYPLFFPFYSACTTYFLKPGVRWISSNVVYDDNHVLGYQGLAPPPCIWCISPQASVPAREARCGEEGERERERPSDLPEPCSGSGLSVSLTPTPTSEITVIILVSGSGESFITRVIVCLDVITIVMSLLIFCTTSGLEQWPRYRIRAFRLSHHHYRVEIVNCQIVIKNRALHQGQGKLWVTLSMGQTGNTTTNFTTLDTGAMNTIKVKLIQLNTKFFHLIYFYY